MRKWGTGAWGRGDPTALNLSEYHPITGKQNLRELPNHSFLNELQREQSDGSEFPRQAFSSGLPFWITRKYMPLGCHSLFSVLSNNGNNQTLCLCSVSWFPQHFLISHVIPLTKQFCGHPAKRKTVLWKGSFHRLEAAEHPCERGLWHLRIRVRIIA